MNLSRKAEIATATVSAVAAAFVLSSCGGSDPAPAASPSPSPTFTALSLPAACRLLRTDILANGGRPDRATLRRIIGHSTDGHLIIIAQETLPDVGKSDGMAIGIDLAFMGRACRSTGVQIPTGT